MKSYFAIKSTMVYIHSPFFKFFFPNYPSRFISLHTSFMFEICLFNYCAIIMLLFFSVLLLSKGLEKTKSIIFGDHNTNIFSQEKFNVICMNCKAFKLIVQNILFEQYIIIIPKLSLKYKIS